MVWRCIAVLHLLLLLLFLILLAPLSSGNDFEPSLSQYGSYSRHIAKGYTADVLLFHRTSDNITFAIKRFFENTIQGFDGEYNNLVREEYHISAALRHEHIISTHDLIYDDHVWYMVMDYCPTMLSNKIARSRIDAPIPLEEVNCIFLQLLEAIAYMHDEGFAHQDLKPNNIGIDQQGRVKLLDFGQSYRFRDVLTNRISMQWALRGGMPYSPFEAYQETKYDPRPVDIFAVAVIFCEMIQPTLPWKRRANPGDVPDRFAFFSQDALEQQFKKQGLGSDVAAIFTSMDLEEQVDYARSTAEGISRLLPKESQNIIVRMLDPIPSQRATFMEILSDSWVKQISCQSLDQDL